MRHDWERHPDSETIRCAFTRVRVCKNCGREQTWKQDQEWGRVKRSYWCPHIGRCGAPDLSINGKLGTHASAIYLVRSDDGGQLDEAPSVGDVVMIRSDHDPRVHKWKRALVNQIKFGNLFYMEAM